MEAILRQRYTSTAVAFHWLLALLILGMVAFGFYVHGLRLSPLRLRLANWHKWIGVTIFLLTALRLAWRAAHPPPPLPATMSAPLRAAASGLHYALYALMFLIPLSGWIMSSAKGFQTVWFGVVPLPNLVDRDPVLGDRLLRLHGALNVTMLVLIGGHVGAALKHHWVDRDDVLVRMLPGRGGRSPG
jgi:cytochrome b561